MIIFQNKERNSEKKISEDNIIKHATLKTQKDTKSCIIFCKYLVFVYKYSNISIHK